MTVVENVKKPVLVLDRVKALEELTNGIAAFLQTEVLGLKQSVNGLKQSEANVVEILNAMMGVLDTSGALGSFGDGVFTKRVQAQLHNNRASKQKEMIEKAVADGMLVAVDRVTDKSLLVGKEVSNAGEVLNGGRSQVEYNQLTEEAKKAALNQGVGAVINGSDGTFEVLEIYELAPQKETTAPESNVESTVNN